MKSCRWVVAWGIVALGMAAGRADAAPLDPSSPLYMANSQGDVTLVGGTYVFNLGTATPTLTFYNGPIFSTVATGIVNADGINVFDFRSLTIGAGANITVNQSSASGPIALLSTTSILMAGSINVSATGSPPVPGGPGAANLGNGGSGGATSAPNGNGSPGAAIRSGGGGGSFGGTGQSGGSSPIIDQVSHHQVGTLPGGAGGGAYGNLFGRLQGGSMGGFGGGAFGGSLTPGAPGFGGGAIELGALGSLTVSGTILANGSGALNLSAQFAGGGGGGSGGGVLIHGDSVGISGTISAIGGAGAPSFYPTAAGGMGGGGQVLVEYNDKGGTYSRTGTVNVGTDATAGQFVVLPQSSVPEPSSLFLLGAAALGGAGWASARRRRV